MDGLLGPIGVLRDSAAITARTGGMVTQLVGTVEVGLLGFAFVNYTVVAAATAGCRGSVVISCCSSSSKDKESTISEIGNFQYSIAASRTIGTSSHRENASGTGSKYLARMGEFISSAEDLHRTGNNTLIVGVDHGVLASFYQCARIEGGINALVIPASHSCGCLIKQIIRMRREKNK